MEGRRLSTELLDNRQEQTILLGRAEPSKSGPAEEANSPPAELCTPAMGRYVLSRAGVLVLVGAILLWLSTISLHPSSNIPLSLAWFPPSSNVCLLEPRATQQDLLPGKEHLSQQSGEMVEGRWNLHPPRGAGCLAGLQQRHANFQDVSSILYRLLAFWSHGTQEKGKEQQAFQNIRKNFFKTYFQCILSGFCVHLLLHSF